ncbi:unnamed protein product [Cercospora beticola]|nr:unnamed protein product [Cercospora beticola]
MAPRYCPSFRMVLHIVMLFIFCLSIIVIYYVNDAFKRVLWIPGQLWFCSIGFELTPSYATAAFSCKSGTEATTNGPILFLDGNEAYRRAMSHLSNDTQHHVGAEEIDNFSAMFSKLVAASEERTREYVHAATVSYPNIPGLVANNIGTDIMRQAFAKIEAIVPVSYEQVLSSLEGASGDIHASHAVLAGHGLGLCQPWKAEQDCVCERHQKLPKETYLMAAYYAHGIEIVLTEETTSVYHLQSYTYSNYSLGYSSKPSSDGDSEQEAY